MLAGRGDLIPGTIASLLFVGVGRAVRGPDMAEDRFSTHKRVNGTDFSPALWSK